MKLKITISTELMQFIHAALLTYQEYHGDDLMVAVLNEMFEGIKVSEKGACKITKPQVMALMEFLGKWNCDDINILMFISENYQNMHDFLFSSRNTMLKIGYAHGK